MLPTAAQVANAHNGRWRAAFITRAGRQGDFKAYLPQMEPGWYVTLGVNTGSSINEWGELVDWKEVTHAWHRINPGDTVLNSGWEAPEPEGRRATHIYS